MNYLQIYSKIHARLIAGMPIYDALKEVRVLLDEDKKKAPK